MRAEQASAGANRAGRGASGLGDGAGAAVALDVQDLRTHLFTRWGVTRAVDGVSFAIREGAGVYSGPRRPT